MGNCFQKNFPQEAPDLSFSGLICPGRVIHIQDGDTLTVVIKIYGHFHKIKIRLVGIDAPELSSGERGADSKEFLKSFIGERGRVVVSIKGFDKYAGRWLGDVQVGGKSAVKEMLRSGHARSYSGRGAKPW